MTISQAIAVLEAEAARFKQLAKDSALRCITVRDGIHENSAAAREHLLRAETFKTAATLLRGK